MLVGQRDHRKRRGWWLAARVPAPFRPISCSGGPGTFTSAVVFGRQVVLRCPTPPFPFPKRVTPEGAPDFRSYQRVDREVTEAIRTTGELQHNDAHAALYAPLDSAEVRVMAARNARIAADDEFADFLCELQEEVVGEAERLLQTRVAE
jgi:hypothetical protein